MADHDSHSFHRRAQLRRGVILPGVGAPVAGTIALTLAAPAEARPGRRTLVLEAACLGDTLRLVPEGDRSLGAVYDVEALLYPEGTIKTSGFDPAGADPIGHWFDRGRSIAGGDRTEPLRTAASSSPCSSPHV